MKQILPVLLFMWLLSAHGQNVGIGETSPGSKLSVKGSLSVGSGYSTTAAPTDGAIILGNVGIGTTTPAVPLQVVGDAYIGSLLTTGNNIINTSNPSAADIVVGSSAGTRHDGSIMWWSNASASRISNTADVFYLSVWNTTSANVALAATIGGASYFQGNVGIGTISPSAQLHTTGTVLFANYPNGMLTTDPSGNLQTRTIVTNNGNQIDVTNGNGVSGNPTINIDNAYAASIKAGFILSGGGNITYNGSAISWSTRFIVINNGTGSQFSTNGYFDITQPASGTVITGAGSSGNVTVTSSGVPLGCWDALYYILPIGSSNGVVNANFRVVQYGSAFAVPETWILIAAQNCDDNTVKVGNGTILQSGETWASGGGTAQNSGSGNYIQNQISAAQSANSWISGTSEAGTLTSTGEVYVQNWFRNNQAGTGLYNQATGSGIYSPSANLMTLYNSSSLEITSAQTSAGNLRFDAANPYITASSYFIAPGGAYFNSGTVYIQNTFEARGGVSNDGASYLTLNGGTSGYTYVSGRLGIGISTPAYSLEVSGNAKILGNSFSVDYNQNGGTGPALGSNAGAVTVTGNWTAGSGEVDIWNTGPAGSNRGFYFWNNTGSGYTEIAQMNQNGNLNASSYSNFSDKRLKSDIAVMTPAQIAGILDVNTYSYKFDKKAMEEKHLASDDYTHFGVLAQELEKLYPNLVYTNDRGIKTVNYIELIPVLIESLKTQNEKIKSLEAVAGKVTELEKEMEALKTNH